MEARTLAGVCILAAAVAIAAESSPKTEVAEAARKLAAQPNYAWTTTITVPENAMFKPGPSEGKTEKDGLAWLSITTFDENKIEFYIKGEKAAVRLPDGTWQSRAEATEGADEFGPAMFIAGLLDNFKTPAVQAEELVAKTKSLEKAGELYSGELTEDAAKDLLVWRPRRGGFTLEVRDAKGTVKFWVKDGMLTKFVYSLEGKMVFGDNVREIGRTTTIEIKDVGNTQISPPEEAKKKMS
ncbi:MAG: hypothetical protein N2379_08610 [Verrucomicrobiae bacterium]|nr:hypothetical protein [Verrucomicrobiae bacterium]